MVSLLADRRPIPPSPIEGPFASRAPPRARIYGAGAPYVLNTSIHGDGCAFDAGVHERPPFERTRVEPGGLFVERLGTIDDALSKSKPSQYDRSEYKRERY